MNRQLTGRITTYYFAPASLSNQNLFNERIKEENIFMSGNTIIDTLFGVIAKMKNTPDLEMIALNLLVSFQQ